MTLDQFYTNHNIAVKCLKTLNTHINYSDFDYILEPSAGTGSFYKLLPIDKRIGLDLEPKYEGIRQLNFFDFKPEKNKKYLVIGNPPFGRIASLAVKFFNKSAESQIV